MSSDDESVLVGGWHSAPTLGLLPLAATHQPGSTAQFVHHSEYALSGGTGALGLLVASWLRAHGACQLSLLSRSGHKGRGRHWKQLQALQGVTSICGCDVSVELAADAIRSMRGVVHVAGVEPGKSRAIEAMKEISRVNVAPARNRNKRAKTFKGALDNQK